MLTNQITKQIFKEFFDEAMLANKSKYISGGDIMSGGCEIYEYEVEVTPKLIIRDFDNPRIDTMKYTGVWDSNDDKEFSNFEQAWAYFETVSPKCRVMDATGSIYADYFD